MIKPAELDIVYLYFPLEERRSEPGTKWRPALVLGSQFVDGQLQLQILMAPGSSSTDYETTDDSIVVIQPDMVNRLREVTAFHFARSQVRLLGYTTEHFIIAPRSDTPIGGKIDRRNRLCMVPLGQAIKKYIKSDWSTYA